MSSNDRAESTPMVESYTGRVRLGDDPAVVASQVEPGDIAVIDLPDLDRTTAYQLADAQPAVVLNSAPSITGRYPNKGPQVLAEAGIPLVDELGSSVLGLQNGQKIKVSGGKVYLADRLIATGQVMTDSRREAALAQARVGMVAQLESFAANTKQFLQAEQELLTAGVGLEKVEVDFKDRPVLVVGPHQQSVAELAELKHFIRGRRPAIIAVGAGAKHIQNAGLKPDLITGNIAAVPDQSLRQGAQIVLHSPRLVQGKDSRLDSMGLAYTQVSTGITDLDLAILIALKAGADTIIPLGEYTSWDEFLDLGRRGMNSSFFTHLSAKSKLVSPQVMAKTYRRPVKIGYVWMLLLAGLMSILAGLTTTPFGKSILLLTEPYGRIVLVAAFALIALNIVIAAFSTLRRKQK
ncbi:hypothetical protein BK816_05490 [Boudabousia tangfeifanii]|uniref:Thiamine pyrophosphokinase n=1 Tax=Boudabousia tangfeifanii TaxID=1912795 RepID=A0A1D9MKJ2_9ACTO|nr:putative cytokinetic ring protein SteA [Boudabousia tangfeifanii]AOZ72815.1 hypothetical protein BK816_05490 [Boudabousia tangfeifanii]